jgi:transcriptional regulator with XRE-family HTH domain
MDYGKAFRIARAIAGLQQAELAESAGLDASHLSLIESGKRNPSLNTIRKFCRALDISEPLLALLAAEEPDLRDVHEVELSRIGESLTRFLVSSPEPSSKRKRRKRRYRAA